MNRAIFSAAIFFVTCFLFQGMALATGGSWGHHHSNTPKVHNLADILKSGEIVGAVDFCGPEGTNGAVVDLVGESFQAVLGASGEFKLRYVPRGAYTLRVNIPGQPDHTQAVTVKKRIVTNVGEIALCPDNDDDGFEPTPGIGAEYCWTASATNEPMLDWANNNPGVSTLPAGDYRPVTPTQELVGCTLNGDWTIRATDDWGIDNGYIFEWTVSFSTDIIPDCTDWID